MMNPTNLNTLDTPLTKSSTASSFSSLRRKKLYDRETQLRQLNDAFDRCCSSCCASSNKKKKESPPELVLITGASGTGKSELARSIQGRVGSSCGRGGFFLCGKFDDPAGGGGKPHGPFITAVEGFVHQLIARSGSNPKLIQDIREKISETIGSELFILLDAIPRLNDIFSDANNSATACKLPAAAADGTRSSNRGKDVLQVLDDHHDHDGCVGIGALMTMDDTATTTCTLSDTSSERSFQVGATADPEVFVSVICRFFHSIASMDDSSVTVPVVLLLDDLQWADPSSLDILNALVKPTTTSDEGQTNALNSNPSSSNLMVIGTCRGNEVGIHDDLSVMLRRLEQDGHTLITDIRVAPLSESALGCMVADTLGNGIYLSECMPLAKILHRQTGGNVFFAKQCLRTLMDEGVLYQTTDTNSHGGAGGGGGGGRRWQWAEEDVILSIPPPTNQSTTTTGGKSTIDGGCGGDDDMIIQLLAKKLLALPSDVIETIKTIACLGSTFRDTILFHATTMVSTQVLLALEVAEEHGFVEYDNHNNINGGGGGGGWGRFPHDKFREAPLSLISPQDKPLYHLSIGRNLRRQLSIELVKANIILIADQIKLGLPLLLTRDSDCDEAERDDFSRLFLRAGKEAAKKSAFVDAANYIDAGIQLLNYRHWRDQYNLSMDLYSTGAELSYCIGDLETVDSLAVDVISNARNVGDKDRVVACQLYSCAGKGENLKPIDMCVEHLREMEQPFPRRLGSIQILTEIVRVKLAMGKKTEEDILALPELTDQGVLSSMKILFIMWIMMISANSKASPVPAFRLVRLTLKHGLSPFAGIGFLLYGIVLIKLGQPEEGFRFGNLAMKIMERFPSKQILGKMQFLFWSAIQTSKFSYRYCLDPMWQGHILALETGESEMACGCACMHSMCRILIGDPIPDIVRVLQKNVVMAKTYGQYKLVKMSRLSLQLCHNLQGNAKDPLVLTGEYIDEQESMKVFAGGDLEAVLLMLLNYKFDMLALMNENKLALSLFQKNKALFDAGFTFPVLPAYTLMFRGLALAGLARECSGWARRQKVSGAKKIHKKLQRLAVSCPDNMVNKMHLMDAELEFCQGRYSGALLQYDRAILAAEKEGFISDQAIACEKAGRMLCQAGRRSEAVRYLDQARLLYMEWGAQAKVEQIEKML